LLFQNYTFTNNYQVGQWYDYDMRSTSSALQLSLAGGNTSTMWEEISQNGESGWLIDRPWP